MALAFQALELAGKNLRNTGVFLVKNVLSSYEKNEAGVYVLKPVLHPNQADVLAEIERAPRKNGSFFYRKRREMAGSKSAKEAQGAEASGPTDLRWVLKRARMIKGASAPIKIQDGDDMADQLMKSVKAGDEAGVSAWLQENAKRVDGSSGGAGPAMELARGRQVSEALIAAAKNGHKEIVEMLLPVSHAKARDSLALRCAAENGHKEIVLLLIPVSEPKADDSGALYLAAWNGHKETVELLLPVSDAKARDSLALRRAAGSGHKEIVEMLIPVSDPLARESEALCRAAEWGHKEIVEMLLLLLLLPASKASGREKTGEVEREAAARAAKGGFHEVAALIEGYALAVRESADLEGAAPKLGENKNKPRKAPRI